MGGVLFLVGAVVTLLLLAFVAAVGLALMVLVAVVIGAERLLAALVPAYRRRRQGRYVNMPVTLRRMVRITPGHSEVIEARSFELPSEQH